VRQSVCGEINRGDRVRILTGAYSNRFGEVETMYDAETRFGPYSIVWVRLEDGHIDGFKPANLEKLGSDDSRLKSKAGHSAGR
jgi:hypothetical protein